MEREITLEEGKIERCNFLMLLSKYKWKVGSDLYPSIHLNPILVRFRGYGFKGIFLPGREL
jgi:hypothetical protein